MTFVLFNNSFEYRILFFFLLSLLFQSSTFASELWLDCRGVKFWAYTEVLEENSEAGGIFKGILDTRSFCGLTAEGLKRDGSTEKQAIPVDVDGRLFRKYLLSIFSLGRVAFKSTEDKLNTFDICRHLGFPKAENFIAESLGLPSREERFARVTEMEKILGDFIALPETTFLMGSPESEKERNPDETQHEVTLDAYEIGATVLSQEAVVKILGENPSRFKLKKHCSAEEHRIVEKADGSYIEYCLNLPADKISRAQANLIIQKLNVALVESDYEYRMATEAEIENALRGKVSTAYLSGDNAVGLDEFILNKNTSAVDDMPEKRQVLPISKLKPNAYGIYWPGILEWASDYYEEFQAKSAINPIGPELGELYVARGALFDEAKKVQRIARRFSLRNDFKGVGLRIVRVKKMDPLGRTARERILRPLPYDL